MGYISRKNIFKMCFTAIFISITCFVTSLFIFRDELVYLSKHPNYGLYFYYNIYDTGVNLIPSIILSLTLPNILFADLISQAKSKFNYFLINREGFNKYLGKSIGLNFVCTFGVYLSVFLLTYIYAKFCFKIDFNNLKLLENEASTLLITGFVNKPILNLILFILLNSFGYAIYSTFLYSINSFVNNIYIVRISGALCYIGSIIISAIIAPLIQNYRFLLYYVLTPLIPSNLISSGISVFGNSDIYLNSLEYYALSVLYYVGITLVILQKIWRER